MERAMRVLQWLATMALVVAGGLLLVKPMRAQEMAGKAGSVTAGPMRFPVTDGSCVVVRGGYNPSAL
jgi:hypothetical protein